MVVLAVGLDVLGIAACLGVVSPFLRCFHPLSATSANPKQQSPRGCKAEKAAETLFDSWSCDAMCTRVKLLRSTFKDAKPRPVCQVDPFRTRPM